jgi:hypothetical protein
MGEEGSIDRMGVKVERVILKLDQIIELLEEIKDGRPNININIPQPLMPPPLDLTPPDYTVPRYCTCNEKEQSTAVIPCPIHG